MSGVFRRTAVPFIYNMAKGDHCIAATCCQTEIASFIVGEYKLIAASMRDSAKWSHALLTFSCLTMPCQLLSLSTPLDPCQHPLAAPTHSIHSQHPLTLPTHHLLTVFTDHLCRWANEIWGIDIKFSCGLSDGSVAFHDGLVNAMEDTGDCACAIDCQLTCNSPLQVPVQLIAASPCAMGCH